MQKISTKDRLEILSTMLDAFETREVKEYFKDMVGTIPDYIFTIPASTTGKYHNRQQCSVCGQLYHVYMFSSILNHIMNLERYRKKYSEYDRDILRCVPLFHDAFKCGEVEEVEKTNKLYTVHEHPLIAGAWVRKTNVKHEIPQEYKEVLARLCERHSGQWNKSNYSEVVLPKPVTEMEHLVHLCDYLSSRMDLTYELPSNLKKVLAIKKMNIVDDGKQTMKETASKTTTTTTTINDSNTQSQSVPNAEEIVRMARYCTHNSDIIPEEGSYGFHLKVSRTVANTGKVSQKQAKYVEELYKYILAN